MNEAENTPAALPVDPEADARFAAYKTTLASPGDDYDIDADLRMHKEDRLRLRVETLRLTRERDAALADNAWLRQRYDCAYSETPGVVYCTTERPCAKHRIELLQEAVVAAERNAAQAGCRCAESMREAARQVAAKWADPRGPSDDPEVRGGMKIAAKIERLIAAIPAQDPHACDEPDCVPCLARGML